MTTAKKFINITLVLTILCSMFASFIIPTSAKNLNNCKWDTAYKFVTEDGDPYGTNTFIVKGLLGKKTVTLKYEGFTGNNDQVKAFLRTVKFKIKIYKGTKLKATYTIGFNDTFQVPAGWGTKYTVKVTPIINKKAFENMIGGKNMDKFHKYSLQE